MKKKYVDPVTGDELTRSEHISWRIQTSVIRNWWFLFFFTAVTIACVGAQAATGDANWGNNWNYFASYMAIFVEAIVGRAMFGQTRRDAQIIRELRAVLNELRTLQSIDAKHSAADYEVSLDVNDKLGHVLEILHDEFEHEDDIEPWFGEWNEQ
jgi:hypothetical protein